MYSLESRVNNGIKRLNNHPKTENWLDKIDLDTLDVSKCSKCVLGQVLGSFHNLDEILTIDEAPEHFGFEINALNESYTDLGKVWKNRIKELKS